ncbi:MAG: S8 family serine peptidase [Chitinophagales bacterium]
MKNFILSLAACFLFSFASAQYSRWLIQFTDKKGTPYTFADPSPYLSQQAIQRRARQGILIDSTDLPITPAYLNSVSVVPNVIVLNYSKWFNQIAISVSDSATLNQILQFSFVKNVQPIALKRPSASPDTSATSINQTHRRLHQDMVTREGQADAIHNIQHVMGNYYSYGNSYAQIHLHEGEWLHNLGFHGEGVTIALLDAGFFGYLTNPAFADLIRDHRILGTYDYVNLKQSVNEENEHGAFCLSIIAANEPGTMTGSAPGAKFWLFKTEDVNSEYPVEEQNWIAAAEFADSSGTDIISTSLGYDYFDDSSFDIHYAQRDGHTAMITKAANLAVAKGMVVTVSAGNSGDATDESKFVDCPADGDSVLAIGATNVEGVIASFSSWGPNASGEIKPNVVSVGQGTAIVQVDGSALFGNGTSFSNPNIAGLLACLWQAFPEFSSHDIRDAVDRSSDRFANPDNQYGYGIPNFRKAYQILEDKREFLIYTSSPSNASIGLYPVPFTNDFTVVFKPTVTGTVALQLLDATGRILETKSVQVIANSFGCVHFGRSYFLPKGVYFIHYDDGAVKKTLKTIKI